MPRVKHAVALFCCSVSAATLAAQRRAPDAPGASKVPVTIDLQVGTETYRVSGEGTCQHAPRGSIYDIPAERWSVQHNDDSRSLALTLWRPRNGSGDMLTLAVTAGAKSHSVNTVNAERAAKPEGSGTATLAMTGKGGTFTIKAATARQTAIIGTVTCGAFTPAGEAAGG